MRGFLLFIISLIMLYILAPIGLFYAMLKPKRGKYLYRVAFSIDQTGNAICGKCFNDILILKNGFSFGHPDHSISSVLGVNQYNGTLSKFGNIICTLLDRLDENHCIKAARTEGLLK